MKIIEIHEPSVRKGVSAGGVKGWEVYWPVSFSGGHLRQYERFLCFVESLDEVEEIVKWLREERV